MMMIVLLLAFAGFVSADFGDTVDPTFNCPALTTCAQVCVATVEDCPLEMTCGGGGGGGGGGLNETLCADGSCAVECDAELESPCEFDCAPVACHRVDDLFDECLAKYGSLYDAEAACGEEEVTSQVTLLQFNEPAFVFGYVWVTVVSFLIIAWCAFNQRIAPFEGATLMIDPQEMCGDQQGRTSFQCTQTGYKTHVVGQLLYLLTMITFAGWSATLLFLTMQFYVLNDQPELSKRKLHIEDEEQLLKTFIIVWNVGFVWCFCLKWPVSIKSLFLRRCPLSQADYVAVFLDNGPQQTETFIPNKFVRCLKKFFDALFGCINWFMALVFSERDVSLRQRGVFEYCKVKCNRDGTRSFTFLFRRYNYAPVMLLPDQNDAQAMPQEVSGTEGDKTDMLCDEEPEGIESPASPTPTSALGVGDGCFVPGVWHTAKTMGDIVALGGTQVGLSDKDVEDRFRVVGLNTIEMRRPTYLYALGIEFKKAFYTYQLFLVWAWFPLYYFYMAMVYIFVILTSAVTVAFFHFRNLSTLYKITLVEGECQVFRNGEWTGLNQKNLVPGDIVRLAPGVTYSDMVLLSGNNVLVDESALTGEATPLVKMAVDATDADVKYQPNVHKRHTISAGTSILEAHEATALVMKTASYTTKGELLREIFAFNRHAFKFDTEVFIVLGILGLVAIFGFSITIKFIDDVPVYGWYYAMYVVVAAIPPLLPTTFTVSVGVSDTRLSNKSIACSNSESILIAGKVSKAIFDKTGTLTKQGLDFDSADCNGGTTAKDESMISEEMAMAMACCHSVAISSSDVLVGNPVDRAMYSASGATMENVGERTTTLVTDRYGKKLEIVRHFDFDHHRMTQSVIVKLEDGTFCCFVKGSGESIGKICRKATLPLDFASCVNTSAARGIYQISVAMKQLDAKTIYTLHRDEVEKDCSFVGFLNFLNALKEETPHVISHLAAGGVDSILATGDNTMNGIRAAQEAGIIMVDRQVLIGDIPNDTDHIVWNDESGNEVATPSTEDLEGNKYHLAVSGKAWVTLRTMDPEVAYNLAPFIRVFGRCTPFDKVAIVDTFVELGFITLMCGDGGNDCGALKAAHVGIALSDAEASIVSPFTSLDRSISSVVEVLREGRCALASALAVYKFLILYGLISVMNQVINAYFQITFYEWNWVFIDGVWVICLAYTLPLARSARKLTNTRPTASILGLQTVSSAGGIMIIHIIFTIIAIVVLFKEDWFQCREWIPTLLTNVVLIGDNYESETLWLVTGYQYISSAMAFNFGYEFRRGWFRNYMFALLVLFFSFMHFYIIFVPSKLSCLWRVNCLNEDVVGGVTGGGAKLPIQNPYNTTVMPVEFQWKVFVIIIANTVAVLGYEYFVVNGIRRSAAKKAANGSLIHYHGSYVEASKTSANQAHKASMQKSETYFRDETFPSAVVVGVEVGVEQGGKDIGGR